MRLKSDVEMPDIQSLTASAHDLSQKVDFWNNAMIWALIVAAIAAAVVVITTRMVIVRSGQLSAMQDQIIQLKEQQLSLDLKDKDVEIGNLKVRASELDLEAGKLRLRLVSQDRRANVLMEPRNRAEFASRLKGFSGQYFDVVSCGIKESEVGYFSMAVWSTLSGDLAGWNIGKIETDSPSCQAGLIILTRPDAPESTKKAARELLGAFIRLDLIPKQSIIGSIPEPPANAGQPGVWFLQSSRPDSVLILIGTHP